MLQKCPFFLLAYFIQKRSLLGPMPRSRTEISHCNEGLKVEELAKKSYVSDENTPPSVTAPVKSQPDSLVPPDVKKVCVYHSISSI